MIAFKVFEFLRTPKYFFITFFIYADNFMSIFRLTFKEFVPQHDLPEDERDKSIVVETYRYPTRGPYPNLEPKRSTIHFTPMQAKIFHHL